MSDKVIKAVKVKDGYQVNRLNEGYQAVKIEQRGYQAVKNCVRQPKPPKTASVIDAPKNKK